MDDVPCRACAADGLEELDDFRKGSKGEGRILPSGRQNIFRPDRTEQTSDTRI